MSEAQGPEEARRDWEDAYGAAPLRDGPFETMSGVPVDPVYGDPPYPGAYPYTRGVYPVDVPLAPLDDAHVRGLRHGRRTPTRASRTC